MCNRDLDIKINNKIHKCTSDLYQSFNFFLYYLFLKNNE